MALHRANLHFRVHQTRGPDHLLHHHPGRLRQLIRPRCGRNVDRLMDAILELLEFQRTVVHGRGQPESVVHQVLLAAAVAEPHAMHLRNRCVALVDKQQKIAGKVVQQRRRSLARQPAGKVPGIVFDSVAVAHGLDHFQIEARALMNSLRLHHAPLRLQLGYPLVQLGHNGFNGFGFAFRLHHVVALGIDGQARIFLLHGAEERIDLRERLNFVAEKFNAVGRFVVGGEDLDHVAAYSESSAPEVRVVALVEYLHQPPRNVFAADALAFFQQQ